MSNLPPFRRPLLLLLVASLAACSSAAREFDPPLTAENEVARLEVTKSQHRKKDLRIWVSLVNKTDKTLVFAKETYVAIVDGKTYKGYSGHGIKITKGYELPPNATKEIKFSYVGVPATGSEAELRFDPIQVQGSEQTQSLSVKVPYGTGEEPGDAVDDVEPTKAEDEREPDK